MKSAYKYIAWLIALEVLVQAAAIAYASFAEGAWVDNGHTLTKQALDNGSFSGAGGYALHSVNGMMVMVVLGIVLLVVAFLSKLPAAPRAAGILLVLIIVQVVLGLVSHAVPILGAVHGILALLVFGYAAMIGVRAMLTEKRAAAPAA